MMRQYIEAGRFGEFVTEIVAIDRKAQEQKNKQEDERKLWELYLHSYSDKSFNAWKEEMLNKPVEPVSLSMTGDQIEEQKAKSRSILKNFSPN